MTDTPVELGAPTLAVSEVFGPTFQGEGPSCGRRAAFIRLARCNLTCQWCDTPYTWDWRGLTPSGPYDPAREVHERTVADVAAQVFDMDVDLVVVTGGEPLLQQRALQPLVTMLVGGHVAVEIETNGTRPPHPRLTRLARFNVSPKLAHSHAGTEDQRIVTPVLITFASLPDACFKFVVAHPDQLAEVDAIVEAASLLPRQVWIMPEGTTAEAVTNRASLADAVLDRGYNLTTRLHVLLWGDERGR